MKWAVEGGGDRKGDRKWGRGSRCGGGRRVGRK